MRICFDPQHHAPHNLGMTNFDVIHSLASAGHSAPSADNSQPWCFRWDGRALAIHYDTARVGGKTFPPDNPATLMAVGAVLDNIQNESDRLGIAIDINLWPAGLEDCGHYADIVTEQESLNTRSPLTLSNPGSTGPLRHANRFPYTKEAISPPVLEKLQHLSEGRARLVILTEPETIHNMAKLVKEASEIRFQTREVHEWLEASLRFSPDSVKKADGLDVRTLGLPPGGAVFLRLISQWRYMSLLNHIGAYKLLASIDSAPVAKAPALIAIVAPSAKDDILDAGKLLNRCWRYVNGKQVAAHPYYVIPDQLVRLDDGSVPEPLVDTARSIKASCENLLDLSSDERMHMLLRVGYPTKKIPPTSLRLPIQDVFTDCSEPDQ